METTELMLGAFVVYYVLGMLITTNIALRGMRDGRLRPFRMASGVVAMMVVSFFAVPIVVLATISAARRAWRDR